MVGTPWNRVRRAGIAFALTGIAGAAVAAPGSFLSEAQAAPIGLDGCVFTAEGNIPQLNPCKARRPALPPAPAPDRAAPQPEPVRAKVHVPTNAEIRDAKSEAANLYAALLRGEASREDFERAQARLEQLTGEDIPKILPPTNLGEAVRRAGQFRTSPVSQRLQDYEPFRQVNDSYCGPATAQSILWALGERESRGLPPSSPDHMVLTGDPLVDQSKLANHFWLATDQNWGTNWGNNYLPFALNTFRGTRWYVQSGAPAANEGLNKEQAWNNIQYSVDHGYPIAVNVLYSWETLYPAGFDPVMSYQHWDTIFGYFVAPDGERFVRLGEVWGDPGLGHHPTQDIPWDTFWPAIGEWYGMVW